MAESQESSSSVNIYPERRRKETKESVEISPFFEPSKTTQKSDHDDTKSPKRQQARLSFSDGRLTNKKPLINPQSKDDPRRITLKDVADETKSLLPGLLATRPDVSNAGHLFNASDGLELDPSFCPGLQKTTVRVLDSDTIDAALSLQSRRTPSSNMPICILNMASARRPGGGWQNGALAQEEALCYRTSLYRTLKRDYYPMPERSGIYSPTVLVIRDSMKNGHNLLDFRQPSQLEVISVVSVAAVSRPTTSPDPASPTGRHVYVDKATERLMEDKIRIILRIAARKGHRQLVLGALGCGVFRNPRDRVAEMFKDILLEPEFQGGWWEDVIFAVMEDKGGNFRIFHDTLDGLSV